MPQRATPQQLTRFVIVGLLSNLALFALYLALTDHDVSPIAAMSIIYTVGVVQTYFVNRSWTFEVKNARPVYFGKYVATYAIGYLVNLAILQALSVDLRWPHQWAQGAAIAIVAALVFVLQKAWVFKPSPQLAQRKGTS